MTSADICKRNGWKPGDLLRGSESSGDWSSVSTILLTAIGEEFVMARVIERDGKPIVDTEGAWDLTWRGWAKVSPSPAASS